MSKPDVNQKRRTALKLAVSSVTAVPLGSLLLSRNAWSNPPERVSEDDRAAVALKYVHDAETSDSETRKPGQLCSNCNLFQGTEGEWRPCSVFQGRLVNENGWCVAWVGRV